MSCSGAVRLVLVALTAGFLSACGPRMAPPPPVVSAPPPDPVTACLAELDRRHVVYERVPDWRTVEGCGIQGTVRVSGLSIPWNRPTLLSCQLALRLWDFETRVVQPAAKATLGRPVGKMVNAGSYDCRGQRGDHPERMSEHAYGRALDVTGFELDDGTRISVLRDWSPPGPKSRFLHETARGACKEFSAVVTPDSNALHRNHLHLDVGPRKYCGLDTVN